MTGRAKTIAVDFDGTLCENRFPEIGEARPDVVEYVQKQAAMGAKIILYTCRENGTRRALLEEAVEWCAAHAIPLYAVNENPDNDYGERFGVVGAGRKLYADLYIDDKSMDPAMIELEKMVIGYTETTPFRYRLAEKFRSIFRRPKKQGGQGKDGAE